MIKESKQQLPKFPAASTNSSFLSVQICRTGLWKISFLPSQFITSTIYNSFKINLYSQKVRRIRRPLIFNASAKKLNQNGTRSTNEFTLHSGFIHSLAPKPSPHQELTCPSRLGRLCPSSFPYSASHTFSLGDPSRTPPSPLPALPRKGGPKYQPPRVQPDPRSESESKEGYKTRVGAQTRVEKNQTQIPFVGPMQAEHSFSS